MIKLQLEDCGTCCFNIDNHCPIWEDATAWGDWCDYYEYKG